MQKVITRFAPSPTGKPHVGNIRTAIFAYLWAKHNKGHFLLRIEDTDQERLVPESLKYIEESLAWLGIDFDQEIIYQSKRKEIHQKYANDLLKSKRAYKCFCTKERLEKLRENQIKKKMPPGYDGLCRNLTKEELLAKKDASYVIRFKMPKNGVAKWDDKIRGEMKINFDISDDPIILKTDGFPTYHLASVVDDHELKITDVIRGEEWISSTPKHLALYEALGWQPPGFAHMPHINGPDGSKLSKRHGDTALLDYRAQGYLPEAIFNFLALLGWNDGTEKEIFEKKELIKSFNLKRIGKSPAVFDIKKLDWMNGHYIRNLTTEQLKNKIIKLLPGSKITKLKNLDRILEVEKTRLVVLCDIEKETDFYLDAPKYGAKLLIFKKSNKTDTLKGLTETLQYFEAERWPDTVKGLNLSLGNVAANHNLSNGDVFWPARVALSGLEKSPSPAELLWVLGKKESLKRIKKAINLLK